MKVLTNQTLYQCDHCGKRLLTKHGAKVHEEQYCSVVLERKKKKNKLNASTKTQIRIMDTSLVKQLWNRSMTIVQIAGKQSDGVKDVVEIKDKHVERAIETLKQMSDKEQDSVKKIDLDYVITFLTNKPHGEMPFQEEINYETL